MTETITDEFINIDLKDLRRDRRLTTVVEALFQMPGASISGACGGWKESMAAFRLLNSEAVTPEALICPHQQAVAQRCADHACIAVSQDTTELDFTRMKEMQGLGPMNYKYRRGLFMHSLYTVSEEGLPLGLWDIALTARKEDSFGSSDLRKQRPAKTKESQRWTDGYLKTCELARQLPKCEVFSISDREGDIFEVFQAWHQAQEQKQDQKEDQDQKEGQEEGRGHAEWIIRANQDRALLGLDPQEPTRLFEVLASAQVLGGTGFEYRPDSGQARTVHQEIRAMKVTPRPPFRKGEKLPEVSFWAILAQETEPPVGEKPVSWLLLTSKEVTTLEQARRILNLYLRRWDIEVFHRVLKTGCRAEHIQLKGKQAVANALTLYAVIAWRILYLTHLGRQCPQLPCSRVFEEAEWRSACAVVKRPKEAPEPSLEEFIAIVGKLGGHLGRKSDGPPGPKAMWQGMARVRDFALAWQASHQQEVD